MEYVKAMEIKARMCEKYKNICRKCPISSSMRESNTVLCHDFCTAYPAESEAILTKWDAENPVKTMMDDFFEKHPNAPTRTSGAPRTCPHECGYVTVEKGRRVCDYVKGDCLECWSRPLQEVQQND